MISINKRLFAWLLSTIFLIANNPYLAMYGDSEILTNCDQTDHSTRHMECSRNETLPSSLSYHDRQMSHRIYENNDDCLSSKNQISTHMDRTTPVYGEIGEGCDFLDWTCTAFGEENYKGLDDEITDCHCENGAKQELYDAARWLCCGGDCRNWPAPILGICTGATIGYLVHDQLVVGEDIDPKAVAALQDSCECCCTVWGTFKDMVGDMCTIV